MSKVAAAKAAVPLQQSCRVASMTTTPPRIKNLGAFFATFPFQSVNLLVLNIPERWSKDGSAYPAVPADLLKKYPKVKVFKPAKDYGPGTKFLGGVEFLRANADYAKKNTVLYVLDDDMKYIPGHFNAPDPHISRSNYSQVVCNWGEVVTFWTPRPPPMWDFLGEGAPHGNLRPVDVVEGFGCYAVPFAVISPEVEANVRKWLELKAESKDHPRACFFSDDYVVSAALAHAKVKRFRIKNTAVLQHQPWALQGDALSVQVDNRIKYKVAADAITKAL